MQRSIWLCLACFACAESADGLGQGELSASRIIEEGTPEAVGVLRMLNDAETTFSVLDIDAALEKRAATNIIAKRNGADATYGTADDHRFTTIAEVDAVSYVGDAALSALLSFAQAEGWIGEEDAYYGTIEGVTFSVTQAEHALDLANHGSQTFLDVTVALDSRAASGIVNLRPFETVEQLAAVPYVGGSALKAMRDYLGAPDVSVSTAATASSALDALYETSGDLWFTSETDARLELIHLPGAGLTPVTLANAAQRLAAAQDPNLTAIGGLLAQEQSIAYTFDRYTQPQDWWEDYQYQTLDQWRAVRAVFDLDLDSATVYRFGRPDFSNEAPIGEIQVFIIGVSREGDIVGLRTIAVET